MKKFIVLIALCLILFSGTAMATGTVKQLLPVTVYGVGGTPMIGIMYPSYVDALALVANSAASYTVPTGAKYLLFSSSNGSDFYVAYSGTAAVPSTSITNGTAPELNPGLRSVVGLTSISIISPNTCVLTISAFK